MIGLCSEGINTHNYRSTINLGFTFPIFKHTQYGIYVNNWAELYTIIFKMTTCFGMNSHHIIWSVSNRGKAMISRAFGCHLSWPTAL